MIAGLLLAAVCVQYDAEAPEPIAPLRGAVLVCAGNRAGTQAAQGFVGHVSRGWQGAELPRVVLVTEETDGIEPRDAWEALQGASLTVSAPGTDAVEFAATLTGVQGLWVHANTEGWLRELMSAPRLEAVRALIAGGGIVACSGEAALAVDAGGVELLQGYSLVKTKADLVALMTAHPDRPAVLLAEGASLLVDDRRMRAFDGTVSVQLGPSSTRPSRGIRLSPKNGVGDFVSLSRAAMARAGRPFPAKPAPAPGLESGSLILVGGGGMPAGTYARFIELAGGPEAPLVYVPCVEEERISREPSAVRDFRRAGAKNVTWIHTKDRSKADAVDFLEPLREAKGVWFGGGRQWNLVDSYGNTEAHRLFHGVLERGGVIGGSSAGASIQASYLARGDPLGNRNIIAEGYERGFGFLTGCAVDQHFSERGRHPDMLSLKRALPQLLGIGIDESTALEVHGTVGEVSGQGRVFFFDTADAPPAAEGASTAVGADERYDLAQRKKLP